MTPSVRDRFTAAARATAAEVFEEPSEDAVRERVRALVAGERVLAWDTPWLPYGVGDVLDAAGAIVPRDAPVAERAAASVGVTGCDGAIAEIGALALASRAGRPRTASLLPPLHVAVVRPDDLRPDLATFFAADAPGLLAESSAIHLIAGPSRTADIELTLTLGVHGPGRVVVILGP